MAVPFGVFGIESVLNICSMAFSGDGDRAGRLSIRPVRGDSQSSVIPSYPVIPCPSAPPGLPSFCRSSLPFSPTTARLPGASAAAAEKIWQEATPHHARSAERRSLWQHLRGWCQSRWSSVRQLPSCATQRAEAAGLTWGDRKRTFQMRIWSLLEDLCNYSFLR